MGFEPVIRERFWLRDTYTLPENFPIHFAGATAFVLNQGNAAVSVSMYDSNDGTTWSLVSFSTHTQASLFAITIYPLSMVALLFTTRAKYVDFRINGSRYAAGLTVDLVQFPPESVEEAQVY